jgi:hypothetical protein
MSMKRAVLAHLTGKGGGPPPCLLDLTLWHGTHEARGSLPSPWEGMSLPAIATALGGPAWTVVRPWALDTPGVATETIQTDGERVTRWETSVGMLTARWTLGPDGDWWQMEYPVKTAEDLPAALEIAQARSYSLDDQAAARLAALVDDDGAVAALELPTRPFSDLLYDMVGLSEGPMLLMMGYPEVDQIVAVLEEKLAACVAILADLPADVAYSPDNLDRQFLAPALFEQYMADSYRRTVTALGPRPLVVHAGGPVRDLLAPLAAAGVAAVEGVCGLPQGDADLEEARQAAGPGLTLWGGIPQDLLLATHDEAAFATGVRAVAAAAARSGPALVGVADRVPVDAEPERLAAVAELLAAG